MSELDEQIENRRRKLAALDEAGVQTYPSRFDHDFEPAGVQAEFGELDADAPRRARARDPRSGASARGSWSRQGAVHRSRRRRRPGAALRPQATGDRRGSAGPGAPRPRRPGRATGRVMRTRAGELSLEVSDLVLLAKSLRPLPEKWHGLTDVEARYRQRYLDTDDQPGGRVRPSWHKRARIIQRAAAASSSIATSSRSETPMMQAVAGGADGAAVRDPPQRARHGPLPAQSLRSST